MPASSTVSLRVMAQAVLFAAALTCAASVPASAAPVDPGPRGGAAGAGGPLPGLDTGAIAFFNIAAMRFRATVSVSGSIPGEHDPGLGPRFNGNSCAACHAHPAVGGSSPAVNPEVALATLEQATNVVPHFIDLKGPVREARFIRRPDGSPDGLTHALFTIAGRTDAPGCRLAQPDFAGAEAAGNLALRIPLGLFGLGLVENVRDASLVAADADHRARKAALGVSGHFNTSPIDGSILRFGWKAQERSLLSFAGQAYNVEMGVSNELFPQKQDDDPLCRFTSQPEDWTNFRDINRFGASHSVLFAGFIRLLGAPVPAAPGDSASRGRRAFIDAGCEACHFESLTTSASVFTGQSNLTFHPYSDFELHRMGAGLADGIVQEKAAADEFRTPPLWGVGQRLFFLHDGRTADIVAAIEAHASAGSEANAVIARFNALPAAEAQDLVNFLRSL